ncbi:MAG: hypothetical protein E4H36_03645 [Spirochaetales bacterium]|nr:MAG: hypothetical protein E4H36_03645 [Spirochaetales bacterium]
MHTAEHILNRTMTEIMGTARSFTSHLDGKKGKCDYKFSRNLTAEETALLERQVNGVIVRKTPVTEEFVTRAYADEHFNVSKLPEKAGDAIRIIRVGGYDVCPCIGAHVGNTSEIGSFRLVSSDYAEGVLRVRFRLE